MNSLGKKEENSYENILKKRSSIVLGTKSRVNVNRNVPIKTAIITIN